MRATIAKLCRLLTKSPAGEPHQRAELAGARTCDDVSALHANAPPLDAMLARLLALHPKRIDLSLGRIERLLAALDHPERRLPPVIHVAGTNGKGSTIAFMRAVLEAAGKRVHVYTSPNLVRINERFRIGHAGGGKLVGDAELEAALAECEAKNGDAPITVFEMETAAGFVLFSRHPADVLLLEVGLGGRLDATNVVERPLASVITRLSLDHREFLGDTLVEIAAEKAGILKPNVPAVVVSQAREALAVIERQAARLRAPLNDCRRGLDRDRGARPAGLSGRRRPARSAGAETLWPASIRKCRRRDRGLARQRPETPGRGIRGRHDAGRLAGAHAAARPRPACRSAAAGKRTCGSTAATMPTAARLSPRRWPISRSACRGRWC